jgi:lysozyme family protein
MQDNFKDSLQRVLVHEGGWADHPRDPGGATMKGVTLKVYREHYGADKSKDDLRNISDAELEAIYKKGYWDRCKCDQLPSGVDYAVFDSAVNSGPGRGAKWLQGAIGAVQDGGIGPNTLAKVANFSAVDIVNKMCEERLSFLQGLDTWSTFGGGWGKRVAGVRKHGVEMAGGTVAETTPEPIAQFETVRRGSSGEWVKRLQQKLGLADDGIFGGGTEAALKAWQRDNGLAADGIAGKNTFRKMGLIS